MTSKFSRREALRLAAAGGAALTSAALTGCSISVFSDTGTSPSGSAVRTLDDIIVSDVLYIGVVTELKPYCYVDDLGIYQGFEIETGRRIAQDLGVGVEFVNVDLANCIMYLENNKVDMFLSCLTVTEARKKKIDYAEPYLQVTTGVISHAENALTSMDDIGTRPMLTAVGSMTELFLTEHYPDVVLEKYDSYSSIRLAFENNPEAVWATDVTDLIAYAKQSTGDYVVGIEALNDPMQMAAAVTKGNQAFLDWLNEEFVTLGSENFFHKNYNETLLDTYGPDYADTFIIEPGQN